MTTCPKWRLGLCLLTSVLVLAAGELLMRRLRPQLTFSEAARLSPTFWQPSRSVPAELKPGHHEDAFSAETQMAIPITINSQGFRNPEFALSKPAGVFRILILGDSFAFNAAMPDAWVHARLLERLLNHATIRPAYRFEVINCGYADGYSPESYIAFMQARGFALAPDLVILQYFVRNDFVEPLETTVTEWKDGLPAAVQSTTRRVDARGTLRSRYTQFKYRLPILRESHLFLGLYQVGRGVLSRLLPRSRGHRFEPGAFRVEYVEYMDVYRDPLPPTLMESLRRSIELIVRFETLSRRRGAPVVVFLIPTGLQVDSDAWTTVFGNRLPFPEPAGQAVPQRLLVHAFSAAGLTVWNPLEQYRRTAQHQRLYLGRDHDGHWTAAGNEVTAYLLFEGVRQLLGRESSLTTRAWSR